MRGSCKWVHTYVDSAGGSIGCIYGAALAFFVRGMAVACG